MVFELYFPELIHTVGTRVRFGVLALILSDLQVASFHGAGWRKALRLQKLLHKSAS